MKQKVLSAIAAAATLSLFAVPVYAATGLPGNDQAATSSTAQRLQAVSSGTNAPNFYILPDWDEDEE